MGVQEKVAKLPSGPGVYLFKDGTGAVLYVGKANNLRKRVSSYFQRGKTRSPRLELLVSKIKDVDHIAAATSRDALLYENSLIKQYQPFYNVALRDDKTYPLLKLTMQEKFPRLFVTRRRLKDGAVYFGPFTDAKMLREGLKILRMIFPLRSCGTMRRSVCLDFHLRQCRGPCAGLIRQEEYDSIVSEVKLFLEGKRNELTQLLSRAMAKASKRQDYEEAARIRDRIQALTSIREAKTMISYADSLKELKSVLSVSRDIETIEAFDISNIMGQEACGSLVYFQKGRPKKSGYKRFKIKLVHGIDDYGMIREVLERHYRRVLDEKKSLPDLIIIDGGKGHLSVAVRTLSRLGISDIPVIGIAKEFERIYIKGARDPLILPKDSRVLHLLERIRDEAHRFAISYHKTLMQRRLRVSELNEIPGIGMKRRQSLLERFGSVERIKAASAEELLKTRGINEKTTRDIIRYFRR